MAKFKKGQSGNPAGRPPGRKDRRTELRALLEPHAAELVAKARELALAGDTTALRLCLERLIPAVKPVDELCAVPGFANGGGLDAKIERIVVAVGEGEMSAAQANELMQVLVAQAELGKIALLEKRIAELEAANA